jgi:NAD-dependent histone deacetylase SIR2
MPTTHVEPASAELLQEVANGLLKARKIVVVTGAGISTNSGIPVCFQQLNTSIAQTMRGIGTDRVVPLQ